MNNNSSLASLNAYNFYKINEDLLSKHIEKISCGIKINRAADNASGLSISEKMRSMIRGLDKSIDNCMDGISFIQVGESVLSEIHSILDRMKELSIQSANGIYRDEIDREALQSEFLSLSKEIDTIAKTTNFNTIPLFNPYKDSDNFLYEYNFFTSFEKTKVPINKNMLSNLINDNILYKMANGKNEINKKTNLYNTGVAKTSEDLSLLSNYPTELFTVIGDTSAYEFDESTGILKIKQAGNFTISGGTKIDSSGNKKVGQILIDSNIVGNVKINLDNVDINQSSNSGKAAFEIGANTNVDLTLSNNNTLISGYGRAGLQVNRNSNLTIDGTGKLDAQGGYYGAGIGSGQNIDGGNIIIKNGDITAAGGMGAAGIGGSESCDIGDITIHGGNIKASNKGHGAGIGGGWVTNNGKITITGGIIDASGVEHGTGIGTGCQGHSDVITITGGIIKAQGGDNGSGIGAGEGGHNTEINITGGTIYAKGGTDGTGIGGGKNATGGDIHLNGGTITAVGGLKADGGNIGSYTDSKHNNPSKVEIGSASIKAGSSGEGLYNTSGATDSDGKHVYSYPLLLPSDAANIISIKSKGKVSNYTNTWGIDTRHTSPDDNLAYIWLRGEDQHGTIDYIDSSGNTKTMEVDIKFYDQSGMFRLTTEPAPPIPDVPNNQSDPDAPIPTPPVPDPPSPLPPNHHPTPTLEIPISNSKYIDYIIIQSGTRSECITIPRFHFSLEILNLDKVDISTQSNAVETISYIDASIEYVSSMRGVYGVISNKLEHTIANNMNASENLSASESKIRDANMAKEIALSSKLEILVKSSQAMIAQSNINNELVLQLLK